MSIAAALRRIRISRSNNDTRRALRIGLRGGSCAGSPPGFAGLIMQSILDQPRKLITLLTTCRCRSGRERERAVGAELAIDRRAPRGRADRGAVEAQPVDVEPQ